MVEFEDKDLITQKELANMTIAELLPAYEKLNKICEKKALQIETIENKLMTAESFGKIDTYSKESDALREDLLGFLAIKDRVSKIIKRNEGRVKYFSKILSDAGIYNETVDKKEISSLENQNIENINEINTGISSRLNGEVKKFYAGTVYTFVNGKLDFRNPENKSILMSADEATVHNFVSKFPESVATIEADVLVYSKIKRMLLKEITAYVYDEDKNKNFREINKSLGNLLSFRKEIPDSLETYVAGVQNMFNVLVKNFLKENFPSKESEIEKNLKCNDKSELIPEERKFKKIEEIAEENVTHTATSDELEYGVEVGIDEQSGESVDSDISELESANPDDQEALKLLEALGIGTSADDEK